MFASLGQALLGGGGGWVSQANRLRDAELYGGKIAWYKFHRTFFSCRVTQTICFLKPSYSHYLTSLFIICIHSFKFAQYIAGISIPSSNFGWEIFQTKVSQCFTFCELYDAFSLHYYYITWMQSLSESFSYTGILLPIYQCSRFLHSIELPKSSIDFSFQSSNYR